MKTLRSYNFAIPLGSTDVTIAIPTKRAGRVVSLSFNLVTDANVAVRVAGAYFLLDGQIIAFAIPVSTQSQSLTRNYCFQAVQSPATSVTNTNPGILPSFPTRPNLQLRYICTLGQVGDAVTNCVLWIEEED